MMNSSFLIQNDKKSVSLDHSRYCSNISPLVLVHEHMYLRDFYALSFTGLKDPPNLFKSSIKMEVINIDFLL